MRLTDTHCHLADSVLRGNLAQVLAEARQAGVWRFIVPATCPQDWQDVAELSEMPSEHGQIRIALGIHPWFSDGIAEQDFSGLEAVLVRYPRAWVGEIGLDFYDKTQTPPQRERQIQVFSRQLAIAQTLRRRVIIHNLKATADIAAAVKQTGFTQGGIVHAFSGSAEEARVLTKLGFKIGIGSLLLNPNARKVRDTLKALNDGDFVLETDSPFMFGKHRQYACQHSSDCRNCCGNTRYRRGGNRRDNGTQCRQSAPSLDYLFEYSENIL